MAVTVLDSGNLEAIVTDATGEGLAVNAGKVSEKEPENKEPAEKVEPDEPAIDDDKEDEDGLTPREKRELTHKMQKAVGKRVRQAREAEEFAAEEFKQRRLAEQRISQLQSELEQARGKPAERQIEAATRPNPGDFATEAEYVEALTDFKVAEAMGKKAADDAKAAADRQQAEILANAKSLVAKAMELVPDFEEVCAEADIEIPPHIAGYMQESPMFAELGYFLAKNPDVAESLVKLTPAKQLVQIGKIEAKLLPFAPVSSAAKTKDGATPISTESNGAAKAVPRESTGEPLSATRRAAPVITPISSQGSGSAVESLDDVRDHIAEFARKKGVNMLRRQRH